MLRIDHIAVLCKRKAGGRFNTTDQGGQHLFVGLGRFVIDQITGRYFKHVVGPEGFHLSTGRFEGLSKGQLEFGGHNGLLEPDNIGPAPCKINSQIQPTLKEKNNHAQGNVDRGADIGDFSLAHELPVHSGEQIGRERQSEGYITLVAGAFCEPGDDDAADEYCSEEGGSDADHQNDGKALDRPLAQGVKYDSYQKCGDVGVDNRAVGLAVTR